MLRRVALLAVVSGCGDNLGYHFDDLVEVSGLTPYERELNESCGGMPTDKVTEYLNAEVEPWLAIDPNDDTHLVAIWQQDRWSNGGANGLATGASFDGGATWKLGLPKFSKCAGGDYTRASDPWVTFAADGTPYAIAIAFGGGRSSVLATASHDGGLTWDDPAPLLVDEDPDVFNDKESITADPHDAGRVYAVWDRTTGNTQPDQPIGTGPAWLARSTGGAWEPARPIFDPGVDNQTIGNIIVVLPDGTLVDVFALITMISSKTPQTSIAIVRSVDRGDTWSAPIIIGPVMAVGVGDDKHGVGVRTGALLPEIAVDPGGALYVAWEDGRFSAMQRDGIALVRSDDGGLTWSAPVQVNGAPDAQAFEPALAVAADHTLGVLYYDTRDDQPNSDAFRAAAWLATSADGGKTFTETRMTSGFDLTVAKLGGAYFLGDYQGLMTRGTDFVPLFGVAVGGNDPTDIFVRP